MGPQAPVAIIDTSAAIRVKDLLPSLSDQQAVFRKWNELAKAGLLAYPRQVVDELKIFATGDLPLLWASNATRYLKFSDPPIDYVRRVLRDAIDAREGGHVRTVVDPRKTHEDADPYVLAEALYIRDQRRDVVVVTNDKFDTDTRVSMITACRILGLTSESSEEFLRALGLVP